MIGLSRGKRILDKVEAKGKLGSGFLYVLNTGISFEVTGKGTVLELNYAEIILVKDDKKETFLISWKEKKETCDVKLKSKNAKEIVEKLTKCQPRSSSC